MITVLTVIAFLSQATPLVIIAILCFDFYVYLGIPLMGLIGVLTAVISLARRRNLRESLWNAVKAAILTHGAVVCVALGMGILGGGFITTQMAGFSIKMELLADLPAIRQWAADYKPPPDAKRFGYGDNVRVLVGLADWPKCIADLNPQDVFVCVESKEVSVGYGGGFGHWGLTVTPTDSWVWDSE